MSNAADYVDTSASPDDATVAAAPAPKAKAPLPPFGQGDAIAKPSSASEPAQPLPPFHPSDTVVKTEDEPTVGTGEDVARSAGGGLTAGTTGLVSGPLTAASWLQKHAIAPAAKAVGLEPDPDPGGMAARGAANVEQAGQAATKGTYFDPTYQPKTTAGEIAKTTAEFVPGALIPGGGEMGVGSKILRRVVMPAAGTELGGAAAPAFGLDPSTGRIIGGLGGAAATAALPSVTRELGAAAETLGTTLPAGSTGVLPQFASKIAQKVPISGYPITAMGERAAQQATTKVGETLSAAGATTPAVGGQAFKTAYDDWREGTLLPSNEAAYNNVTAITGSTPYQLDNSRQVAGDILGKRADAKIGPSPAVSDIAQALQDPRGMSFDAMKNLRTTIGAKIPSSVTPVSTDAAEYKQLYGALTEDMKNAATQSNALPQWQQAETTFQNGLDRQKAVASLIGRKGDASPESVIAGIQSLAGSKAGADIGTLQRARSTIGDPAWQKIAGTVAQRMGDDGTGNLSLAKLSKSYNSLTPEGREVLFPTGSPMRNVLDAIDPVTKSLQGMGAGLSKAAHGVGGGVLGGAGYAIAEHVMDDPILALKAAGLALPPSILLSLPATGSSFAKYVSAYRAATVAGKLGRGTLEAGRALQGATRNLTNTINSSFGQNLDPDQVYANLPDMTSPGGVGTQPAFGEGSSTGKPFRVEVPPRVQGGG